DEAAHLGIPASRLVAEMNAGLQKLAHRYDGHRDQFPFLVVVSASGGPGWNRHPSNAGTTTQVNPPGWVRKPLHCSFPREVRPSGGWGRHHTRSAYTRGLDMLQAAYNYFDLVPKGRDEDPPRPGWVRRHDEYG